MTKSISREKLKHFTRVKEYMTEVQKRRLLEILKTLKEEYTGNVGGETDIRNAMSKAKKSNAIRNQWKMPEFRQELIRYHAQRKPHDVADYIYLRSNGE